MRFGVGTRIGFSNSGHKNMHVLNFVLQERQKLRTIMITMAIERGDIEMLVKLKAREIPLWYHPCSISYNYHRNLEDTYERFYDEEMIVAISNCENKKILEYFSKQIDIKRPFTKFKDKAPNKFIFTFLGDLINLLIQKESDYAELLLKSAIKHNMYVYSELKELFKKLVNKYKNQGWAAIDINSDNDKRRNYVIEVIYNTILNYFYLSSKNNLHFVSHIEDATVANIVQISTKSKKESINELINKLYALYEKICNIKPIIEKEV